MRRVGTEKTDLSVKRFDFIGGKKLDGSVLPIEARRAGHLPAPQAADERFEVLVRLARQHFAVSTALLTLNDAQQPYLQACAGLTCKPAPGERWLYELPLGAGSLVPPGKRLLSGFLYVGSPARQARALTDKERAYFSYSASNYVALKDLHQAS